MAKSIPNISVPMQNHNAKSLSIYFITYQTLVRQTQNTNTVYTNQTENAQRSHARWMKPDNGQASSVTDMFQSLKSL
jgi:hypothetical protein